MIKTMAVAVVVGLSQPHIPTEKALYKEHTPAGCITIPKQRTDTAVMLVAPLRRES